jgi:hypothetical protein
MKAAAELASESFAMRVLERLLAVSEYRFVWGVVLLAGDLLLQRNFLLSTMYFSNLLYKSLHEINVETLVTSGTQPDTQLGTQPI